MEEITSSDKLEEEKNTRCRPTGVWNGIFYVVDIDYGDAKLASIPRDLLPFLL